MPHFFDGNGNGSFFVTKWLSEHVLTPIDIYRIVIEPIFVIQFKIKKNPFKFRCINEKLAGNIALLFIYEINTVEFQLFEPFNF